MKNDKLIETDSVVIQINNRNGERYTNVGVKYSKNQKISDLNGWIEDATGIIVRKLKNGDITDRNAISDYSLYEDDFVKTFQLKHDTYPYRIVYSYRKTTKDFISIGWEPGLFNLVPTHSAKLVFISPKNFKIRKYSHNIMESVIDTVENSVRYRWESEYLKPFHDEIYSVSNRQVLPYVIISPIHFVYGVEGENENWQTFGNWQYRLIKDLGVLPEDEKIKVAQLIKGISDKREIVKVLYHYLQDHTRYINVTIDVGGLKPYPASYVAQNKYGDCKALSNYMKALLNFAGINSFYTIIYRGEQPFEIIKSLPCAEYFNHAILTVPLGKDTIWLENTSNTGPFGNVSYDIQNREALVIDEFDSKLIKMPVLNKFDVMNCRKIDVTFTEAGHAAVLLKASFKGGDFDYFNQLKSDLNKDEQDEVIRKIIKISNFDLIQWELNKPHRDTASIDLSLKLTLYKALKALGQENYFSNLGIGVPVFSNPKERANPVEISCPIYEVDSATYHLPVGYEIKSIPEKVSIVTIYGNYEFSVEPKGSVVMVFKKFELFSGNYSLSQYPDFYKFISAVNDKENTKILIKKKYL